MPPGPWRLCRAGEYGREGTMAAASPPVGRNAQHGDNPMKLYRFLTGPDDSSFCHKVSAALDKGWELHGGPTYGFDAASSTMRCGQAVVKELYGHSYDPSMTLGDQ